MDYMESLDVFGLQARQRPCLKGNGEPTTSTKGTVGELYMDTTTGLIYKCIGESKGVYTWQTVGMSEEEKAELLAKIKNPDYNQNDPTQPDYIKGRPFYEYEEVITDMDITDDESGWFIPCSGINELTKGDEFVIEITPSDTGETVSQKIVVESVDEYGRPNVFSSNVVGEYFIDWVEVAVNGTVSVFTNGYAIVGHVRISKPTIVPMDEKFLPESVVKKEYPFIEKALTVYDGDRIRLDITYSTDCPDLAFAIGDTFRVEAMCGATGVSESREFTVDSSYVGGFPEFEAEFNCGMYVGGSGDYFVAFAMGASLEDAYRVRVTNLSWRLGENNLPLSTITTSNIGEYTVPHIKSDGTFVIENLDTGVYVLEGDFVTSTGILAFSNYMPVLCHVLSGENTVSLFYQDTAYSIYQISVTNGTIDSYECINLFGVLNSESISHVIPDDDSHDNRVVSALAVKNYIRYGGIPSMRMKGEDGKLYNVTIGSDGNLKATPWS